MEVHPDLVDDPGRTVPRRLWIGLLSAARSRFHRSSEASVGGDRRSGGAGPGSPRPGPTDARSDPPGGASIDPTGRISVDRRGRIHRYDRAGRLVSMITADGRAWRFVYDELGRLTRERTPLGRRCFVYDTASRLVEVVELDGPDRSRTVYGWDGAGRRIVERHSDGRVVRYRWNSRDRLVGITTVEADGPHRHRSIDHDPLGRPVLIDGDTVITWHDRKENAGAEVVGIGVTRVLRAGSHTRLLAPGEEWSDGIVDDPWGHGLPGGIRVGHRGVLTIDGLVFTEGRVYDPGSRSFLDPGPRSGLVPRWELP